MGTTTAKFDLEHYEHMVACGAFAGGFEKRVELLWGEIVEMTPIGPPHADSVDYLARWSMQATSGHPIRVRIQNAIRLPQTNSEPQPEVCWVREGDYSKQHPGPEDVLLVIEIEGKASRPAGRADQRRLAVRTSGRWASC